MSIENLTTFFSQVGTDPELAAKITAIEDLSADEKATAIAKIAAENGTPFTAEELQDFFTATVSDEELSGIAGGVRGAPTLTHEEAGRRRERFENFLGDAWDKTKEYALISGIDAVGKIFK